MAVLKCRPRFKAQTTLRLRALTISLLPGGGGQSVFSFHPWASECTLFPLGHDPPPQGRIFSSPCCFALLPSSSERTWGFAQDGKWKQSAPSLRGPVRGVVGGWSDAALFPGVGTNDVETHCFSGLCLNLGPFWEMLGRNLELGSLS